MCTVVTRHKCKRNASCNPAPNAQFRPKLLSCVLTSEDTSGIPVTEYRRGDGRSATGVNSLTLCHFDYNVCSQLDYSYHFDITCYSL